MVPLPRMNTVRYRPGKEVRTGRSGPEPIDLPESERVCAACRKSYAPFGSETSEILEIVD